MVVIDTDVLIKCLQNDPDFLHEVTDLLEHQSAVITPMQVAEIYAKALPEEIPVISSFLDLFKVQEVNRKVAEMAGEFLQQYKTFYPDLTITDCLVAAVAAIQDYEIYTMQPKHFPMTEVRLYYKTIRAITVKSRARLDRSHSN